MNYGESVDCSAACNNAFTARRVLRKEKRAVTQTFSRSSAIYRLYTRQRTNFIITHLCILHFEVLSSMEETIFGQDSGAGEQ